MWGRTFHLRYWPIINHLYWIILTSTPNTETYHSPKQRYMQGSWETRPGFLTVVLQQVVSVCIDRQNDSRRHTWKGAYLEIFPNSSGWGDHRCYSCPLPFHLSSGSSLHVQQRWAVQMWTELLSQNHLQLYLTLTQQVLDCGSQNKAYQHCHISICEKQYLTSQCVHA